MYLCPILRGLILSRRNVYFVSCARGPKGRNPHNALNTRSACQELMPGFMPLQNESEHPSSKTETRNNQPFFPAHVPVTRELRQALLKNRSTVVYVILLGVSFLFVFINPHAFPADDGFFYAQVARNLASTGRSTFNTIAETNGYHPLWQLLCWIVALPGYGNPDNLLRMIVALQAVLFALSAIWFGRLCATLGTRRAWVGIGLLAIVFIGKGTLFLLESHLALFFVVLTTRQLARIRAFLLQNRNIPLRMYVLYGVCLGLLILSRLDMVFFAACSVSYLAYLLVKVDRPKKRLPKLLTAVAPAGVLTAGYMAVNRLVFDAYFPVSGTIKSSFPHVDFAFDSLGVFGQSLLVLSLALVLCVALRRKWCGKYESREVRDQESILLLLLVSHLLYSCFLICFQRLIGPWYFIVFFVAAALYAVYLLGMLTSLFRNHRTSTVAANAGTAVLLVISIAMSFARGFTTFSIEFGLLKGELPTWRTTLNTRRFAEHLKTHLPHGAGLLMFDNPGIIQFYTHGHVRIFPLDGLMNSVSYEEDVLDERLLPFLCRREIDFICCPIANGNQDLVSGAIELRRHPSGYTLKVFTPGSGRCAGQVTLSADNLVSTAANPVVNLKGIADRLGIWRAPCPL